MINMNISKFLLVAILGSTFLVGCKNEGQKQTESSKDKTENVSTENNEVAGKIEKASFQIEGMTCALGCAKLIEGKLVGLDGVKKATVDFDSKTALVEFDDAKQTSETITSTVEKIANGIYKVENMEVTPL